MASTELLANKRPDLQSLSGAASALLNGAPPPTAYRETLRLNCRMCESDDIKDVFAEMKGTGFDTKAVRTIIRLRKKDAAERQEEEAILDLYKAALGME